MKRLFGMKKTTTTTTVTSEPTHIVENLIMLTDTNKIIIESIGGTFFVLSCDFSIIPIKILPNTQIVRDGMQIFLRN